MLYVIIFIIGILVGGGAVMFFVSPLISKSSGGKAGEIVKTDGLKAHTDKRREIMEERKGKILELLRSSETITNNDIEKLLSVSDDTAFRYLEELEQEGKITQKGDTGKSVYYELKNT